MLLLLSGHQELILSSSGARYNVSISVVEFMYGIIFIDLKGRGQFKQLFKTFWARLGAVLCKVRRMGCGV